MNFFALIRSCVLNMVLYFYLKFTVPSQKGFMDGEFSLVPDWGWADIQSIIVAVRCERVPIINWPEPWMLLMVTDQARMVGLHFK